MSARRVLLVFGGLSVVPLLFLAGRLHADVNPSGSTGAVSSAPAGGVISNQPQNGESVAGSPPEPSPLAPISAPSVQAEPGVQFNAASHLTESAAQLAISGAARAPSPIMPATPPADVVEDSRPIAGSVFDREDDFNRHPVNSARAITGSTFDREDRVDEHPVP